MRCAWPRCALRQSLEKNKELLEEAERRWLTSQFPLTRNGASGRKALARRRFRALLTFGGLMLRRRDWAGAAVVALAIAVTTFQIGTLRSQLYEALAIKQFAAAAKSSNR